MARREQAVGSGVVDRVLAFRHASQILVERDGLAFALARAGREAEQLGDALAVAVVLGCALLEHVAELVPEALVLFRLVRRDLLEQVQHALDRARAHLRHEAVVLQELAAHVQRQIVGIDHAPHEAQVRRQELLARVHHEQHAGQGWLGCLPLCMQGARQQDDTRAKRERSMDEGSGERTVRGGHP